MIESLENRRLLTVTVVGGVLTVTEGGTSDTVLVQNNGSNLRVIENGSRVTQIKANKVQSISIIGNGGHDTLTNTSFKPAIINGGAGNDVLSGGSAGDEFIGGADTDAVTYATRTQALTLTIGGTPSGANGGLEGDNIHADIEQVIGGSGADTMTGTNNAERLDGGGGNDSIAGLNGNDTVVGNAGNDQLTPGAGDDTSNGGADNDLYIIVPGSTDQVFDSGGIDTLDFSGVAPGFLGSGIGLNLSQSAGQNQFYYLDDAFIQHFLKLNGTIENVKGTAQDDSFIGNTAGNRLEGNGGDDTLAGVDGADTFIGGTGDDSLNGGNQNDTFDGVSTTDDGEDIIEGGPGFDKLDMSLRTANLTIELDGGPGSGESGENDDVSGVEHAIGGSGNDIITVDPSSPDFTVGHKLEGRDGGDVLGGGDGNDTLEGGAGNDGGFLISGLFGQGGDDILDGGTGDDYLEGGNGNDTYRVTPGSDDVVSEIASFGFGSPTTGTDTIDLSGATLGVALDLSLDAYQPQLVDGAGNTMAVGGDFEVVIGSSHDDDIVGNALANTLKGGAGDDTLSGGDAGDQLFGEAGNDSLFGGAGNDLLTGGANNDKLFGEDDDDLLVANDGSIDTVDGGSGGTDNDSAIYDGALDIVNEIENPQAV